MFKFIKTHQVRIEQEAIFFSMIAALATLGWMILTCPLSMM
jgi:hypothetical protein